MKLTETPRETKSRKEILNKLFKGPLLRAFKCWREGALEPSEEADRKEESKGSGTADLSGGEGGKERKMELSDPDLKRELVEMRRLHEEMHNESMAQFHSLENQMSQMSALVSAVTAVVSQLCQVLPTPSFMPGGVLAGESPPKKGSEGRQQSPRVVRTRAVPPPQQPPPALLTEGKPTSSPPAKRASYNNTTAADNVIVGNGGVQFDLTHNNLQKPSISRTPSQTSVGMHDVETAYGVNQNVEDVILPEVAVRSGVNSKSSQIPRQSIPGPRSANAGEENASAARKRPSVRELQTKQIVSSAVGGAADVNQGRGAHDEVERTQSSAGNVGAFKRVASVAPGRKSTHHAQDLGQPRGDAMPTQAQGHMNQALGLAKELEKRMSERVDRRRQSTLSPGESGDRQERQAVLDPAGIEKRMSERVERRRQSLLSPGESGERQEREAERDPTGRDGPGAGANRNAGRLRVGAVEGSGGDPAGPYLSPGSAAQRRRERSCKLPLYPCPF